MRRENRPLLVSILFPLLASCAHKSSSENTSAAAAEIQHPIKQRFRANSSFDWSYYEHLLRPNFLRMPPAPPPISTKQQYLDDEFVGGCGQLRAKGAIKDLWVLVDHDTAVAS